MMKPISIFKQKAFRQTSIPPLLILLFSAILFPGCPPPPPELEIDASQGLLCLETGSKFSECQSFQGRVAGLTFSDGAFALIDFGKLESKKLGKEDSKHLLLKKPENLGFEVASTGHVKVLGKEKKVLEELQLEEGDAMMLTETDGGLLAVGLLTPNMIGSQLSLNNDSLAYRDGTCPLRSGFTKAQLSSFGPSRPGEFNGCLWHQDDGIGTMVVIDDFDIRFSPTPLFTYYARLFAGWHSESKAKSDSGPEHCEDRVCRLTEPDFANEDGWQYVCRLSTNGLRFATDRDGRLIFRDLLTDLFAIGTEDPDFKIGLQLFPHPSGIGNELHVYRFGPDLQIEFFDGFTCEEA